MCQARRSWGRPSSSKEKWKRPSRISRRSSRRARRTPPPGTTSPMPTARRVISRRRPTPTAAPPVATLPAPTPAAPARPDPAALIAKGDAAYAAKEYRNALFAYQDAIIADPRNVPALIKAGHAYARLGHSPEAVDQWNKALQLDPQNAEARAALAEFRDRPGALPTPAAAPPPPITTAPNDEAGARAHYTAGVNLINQRKYAEALAELDQSLSLKPRFAVA